MRPRDAYASIPPLRASVEEVSENEHKARVFLESFFPAMGEAEEEAITPEQLEIHWEPITELEVQKALTAARGQRPRAKTASQPWSGSTCGSM